MITTRLLRFVFYTHLQVVSKFSNTELPSASLNLIVNVASLNLFILAVTDCCKAKTFCGGRASVQSTTGEATMKRVSFGPILSGRLTFSLFHQCRYAIMF